MIKDYWFRIVFLGLSCHWWISDINISYFPLNITPFSECNLTASRLPAGLVIIKKGEITHNSWSQCKRIWRTYPQIQPIYKPGRSPGNDGGIGCFLKIYKTQNHTFWFRNFIFFVTFSAMLRLSQINCYLLWYQKLPRKKCLTSSHWQLSRIRRGSMFVCFFIDYNLESWTWIYNTVNEQTKTEQNIRITQT